MENVLQQSRVIEMKNACVHFMFAYQKQDAALMLSFCDPEGEVYFKPLCWGHGSYVRHMGWWKRGGIRVVEGWDSVFAGFKRLIANNPAQNQQKTIRKNYNFRTGENMAWCTLDGYGQDNKEPDVDMPGPTRETRIFEKQGGEWKIVYVGWLLNG